MSFANNLFLLLLIVGCNGVKFDPDFYVADHNHQVIVSERGDVISAGDVRFDQFACMSIEKVKELKQLLMGLKVGTEQKMKIRKEYQQLVWRMNISKD